MKSKSINETIKEKIDVNSNKIYPFVKWFVDTPTKDRTKENYDKCCKGCTAVEFEHAMTVWLKREDIQEAIKTYMKTQKNIKIIDIYYAMYEKAINKGDVNAAKWIIDFSKSDFFENNADEANDYLSGIDIPALKKSGDK